MRSVPIKTDAALSSDANRGLLGIRSNGGRWTSAKTGMDDELMTPNEDYGPQLERLEVGMCFYCAALHQVRAWQPGLPKPPRCYRMCTGLKRHGRTEPCICPCAKDVEFGPMRGYSTRGRRPGRVAASEEVEYQFRHPNLVIRAGQRGPVITSRMAPMGGIHGN